MGTVTSDEGLNEIALHININAPSRFLCPFGILMSSR